ncbi:MAG TPA: ATP-binding protein, partial [Ramlibacter sp.]|nr:ATP-binding protein [Ramlibacter sp.]
MNHDAARSVAALRLLMLLAVAVPLLAFAGFAAYRHQQMRDESELRLDRALRVAHEHALRVFDTNETLLGHVLDLVGTNDDAGVLGRREQLHRQLVELSHNKPQLRAIRVFGADGVPLVSSRSSPAAQAAGPPDHALKPSNAQRQGGTSFTVPLADRATREVFFDQSLARRHADGSFAGLVSASLLPSYFTRFHADLAADEPGLAITMFREDGAVYSRWPPLASAPGRMSPSSPVLSRVLKGDSSGIIRGVSSLDGQDRLIMFRKLGDYPVYLGTGRELSAIRSAWLREMGVIAMFGLVPVLGILFTAYVAIRRTRDALRAAQKLREESLARQQMEDALFQAQKLEALGRLTGGVAHDFNNALMVISGNLHLLRLAHPGAGTRFTDAMGRAVESATKLTRQLLAFSRRQALRPETVSLQAWLPALGDLLTPTLGSNIRKAIDVAPDTRPVDIDTAELELAVINLAVNARDAMPDGGLFSLRAGNSQRNSDGGVPMVVIEASDSGTGIDPALIGKVFEPFFTTKPVGKGTGLGLSQVYALCKRAGGDATVESQPGQGTTTRMFFPASSADGAQAERRQAECTRQLGKSVLVVEDNDEVAAVVEPVLKGMGCGVVRLEGGAAALDWLEGNWNTTDIVLTDVVMPGEIDGLALASRIKALYPGLKVLVMTGYAEQLDTISRLGFEVLPKPFSPQMLAEALERGIRSQAACLPLPPLPGEGRGGGAPQQSPAAATSTAPAPAPPPARA